MKENKIRLAIKNVLALAAAGSIVISADAMANKEAAPGQEKCYGIVKAGMNDCETAGQSCAGSATKDNQKDAYLFLATGLCKKIVGGSLTKK